MKRNLIAVGVLTVCTIFLVQSSFAQDEWYQGRSAGIYSIGFGGTQGIIVGAPLGTFVTPIGTERAISFLGASINVAGEYRVWKFIGVGWQSGINIFPYPTYYGLGGTGIS